jgi:hypothetical protein
MKDLAEFEWPRITSELDSEGHALLPGLLTRAECEELRVRPSDAEGPTWAVPDALHRLRADLYARLVPLANRWRAAMGEPDRYPDELVSFWQLCKGGGQAREQSKIALLLEEQFVGLDQNAEGTHVFPVQTTVLLSEPGRDFTGGEIVLTEQRPRIQSRPIVITPRRGDALIFAVHHRPLSGSRGFYRATMKHAVSRVHGGERVATDLVFHRAPSP